MAGVAAALVNRLLAQTAERRNRPAGRFVDVRRARLHYVEHGSGFPLVLLHGNGSMVEDFQSSGLIDLAAENYRVIAFDRPGFGHSYRPPGRIWTPEAQADLIHAALIEIGVSEAIILGHSWGTLVGIALALRYPRNVKALVLASGYYYPTVRADVVAFAPLAVPIIGEILNHTISPLLARLMWPLLLRKIFGPRRMPTKFSGFPEEMAVRPSQLRAAAADSTLMVPAAHRLRKSYGQLEMPVVIVTGAEDRVVDGEQSAELHRDIPGSLLRTIPANGHMIHQTATSEIMSAIDAAAEQVPGITRRA
jgi:pimeloyl-ACP methyl ester carboxylesterase